MGVLDPGIICPTDGQNYIDCPGYFGHINLARPVFYIQYLNTVMKIIKSVCIKCSKLLINKDDHLNLLTYSSQDRWDNVFQLCNKVKRCGEKSSNGCGCLQPEKIKKEGFATLIAEWSKKDNSEELKETIDNYLKNLIEYINEPTKDCPNCNGSGIILKHEDFLKICKIK
jgi:DNA-directed RNA polymerase II subunit RPB1